MKRVMFLVFAIALMLLGFSTVGYAADDKYEYMPAKSGVEVNKPWSVKFNMELNTDTVNSDNIYIVDDASNRVNATVFVQADNKTISIIPRENYKYGKTYSLVINTNIQAASKNNLAKPKKMIFTTKSDTQGTASGNNSGTGSKTDGSYTICIDAGRGGDSKDVIGPGGLRSKDINLAVALKLGKLLESKGVKVVYTRTSDVNVDNELRFKMSDNAKADYFVSIHCNTAGPTSTGTETYYGDGDRKAGNLAQVIQDEMGKAALIPNRGAKPSGTMPEIKGTAASAVKVYLGFLSNADEEKKLGSDEYQNKCAQAIANALIQCKNVDSDLLNVVSVKSVIKTITEGQSFALPQTVTATLVDNSTKELQVSWDTSAVNTSKAGTYTCKGTVSGYRKPIFASIIVTSKNSGNKPTICIDPGHGGYDPGTIGASGKPEKDITLSVALKVGDILKSKGINVVFTRTDDNVSWPPVEVQDLDKRCKISDSVKANYFVAIHCNSTSSVVKTQGTETFYSDGSYAGQILADTVQKNLVQALGTKDRGISARGLYVLKYTDAPSILTELGFIDNAKEEQMLLNNENQNKCADAIARAILQCIGK